ncbi:hypothetical protein SpCBS45565_g08159 [Spizellomyces sp. 'palustris']|nr:hypothetical protein SpCBS45565_g08159 [Spizellomyces sp. 'palustris']
MPDTSNQDLPGQPLERRDTIVHEHPDEATDRPITRVVVIALDSSKSSDYAFNWALDNFLSPEKDLCVLVNVRPIAAVPGPFGTAYMDFTDYVVQVEERYRTESHALLQRYASLVKKRKIAVKAIAMRGDPREELCRKVEELDADAFILGSRGLGTLKRVILGSISDYCVHHVKCPVLVIKNKDAGNGKEERPVEGVVAAEVLPASNPR